MFAKRLNQVFLNNKPLILSVVRCASVQEVQQESQNIHEPEHRQKLLKLAVVGVPNAGKSTFINNLMDRKVCATSPKVHTTRARARAILNEGDSQIVFVDTPGIVSEQERNRYKLESSFFLDKKNSLAEADIIGVIHDASNMYTRERLDIKVIKVLEENIDTPSFLVFNKVDVLKSKRKLLDLTRLVTDNSLRGKKIPGSYKEKSEIRGWPHFDEVFMVSALTGNGLSDVKEYLLKKCKPGKWQFPSDVWTDQKPEDIILRSVKAIFLQYLQQEIPYTLKPEIEFFEVDNEGVIKTVVLVTCPTERIAELVSGEANGRLRQMTEQVQYNLQNTFQNYVKLRIVLRAAKEK